MVNHEGTVGITCGKHLADEVVRMLDFSDKVLITLCLKGFVLLVEGAEGMENVSRNELRIGGGIPNVRFYA